MAFDFPASPLENQPYNGFVYRGGRWRRPAIRTALAKNYICNPAMQISQQNGAAAAVSSAGGVWYEADQWMARWAAATALLSAGLVASPTASPYAASLYCGTAKAVLAAGEYHVLTQRIEGTMMADFQWGTSAAKDAVLTFLAKHHTAGTYSVRIGNSDELRSFVATFTLAADVWQRVTVPIPAAGAQGGTWAKDTSKGAQIDFVNAVGSNYVGLAQGGWQTGGFYAVPGQTNGIAVADKALAIADVGLYLDPYATGIAPPFVIPDFASELRRCQRFWYRAYGFQAMAASATIGTRGGMRHPVPMRTTPVGTIRGTPRLYDGGATPAITALGTVCNPYAAEFDITAAAGGMTAGRACAMYYQGDDASYIEMSARM